MTDTPNDSKGQPPGEPAEDAVPPPPKMPTYSDPVTPEEYARMTAERDALRGVVGQMGAKGPLKSLREAGSAPNQWMRYSGLGIQMAATLILPVLGGMWLDKEYGWEPWGVVLGGMVGATASVTSVIMTVQRAERAEAKQSKPKK